VVQVCVSELIENGLLDGTATAQVRYWRAKPLAFAPKPKSVSGLICVENFEVRRDPGIPQRQKRFMIRFGLQGL
jgi:hypothetical protein